MIKIIEMDQWSSTADNIENLDFDDCTLDSLHGGDSEAAKKIFGGKFNVTLVKEDSNPYRGYVWFIKDETTGKLKRYKANYDSSD